MSTTALARAGWGGLLAAVFFVTSTVIDQIAPVQTPYVSVSGYLHQAALVLVFQCAAGAVLGVYLVLRSTGRLTALSLVAAVLAGTGYLVVGLLSLVNLVQGERTLVQIRMVAALVLLVGSALLGVLVLITRALPWWCGVLLIVAFPLGDVANQVFRGAEGLLLALLWGSIGVALLTRASRGDQHDVAVRQRVTA